MVFSGPNCQKQDIKWENQWGLTTAFYIFQIDIKKESNRLLPYAINRILYCFIDIYFSQRTDNFSSGTYSPLQSPFELT